MKQCYYRSYFHFTGFYFLSEKFRCATYHQTADKYRDNNERIIIHPTYAYTAEPSINLHIQHLHHTGQRHSRIMHTIHRTIGSNSSHNAPKCCSSGTQTNFLTFHRTVILRNSQFIDTGISTHFLTDIDTDAYQESKEHHSENTISQFLSTSIKP